MDGEPNANIHISKQNLVHWTLPAIGKLAKAGSAFNLILHSSIGFIVHYDYILLQRFKTVPKIQFARIS